MNTVDLHSHAPSGQATGINQLPTELLSCIFDLAAHWQPNEEENTPRSNIPFNWESVKAPLSFSAVCRRWRSVAHGSPSLWTRICATIGSIQTLPVPGTEDELHIFDPSHFTTYLSLSKNYPIDILIDARDPDWDFSEPEYVFISL